MIIFIKSTLKFLKAILYRFVSRFAKVKFLNWEAIWIKIWFVVSGTWWKKHQIVCPACGSIHCTRIDLHKQWFNDVNMRWISSHDKILWSVYVTKQTNILNIMNKIIYYLSSFCWDLWFTVITTTAKSYVWTKYKLLDTKFVTEFKIGFLY